VRDDGFVLTLPLFCLDDSLKTEEAPDEAPTKLTEAFLELKCNITKDTNYLITGIKDVRKI
jgi:hypothetical protein